jgi:hypothetical protein
MQAMLTDIGLARPQAFSAATLLILGSGLALYQMTSLMLGPAGSRQLDLSLSLPTVETRDLAESPAASGGVIGNLVIPVPLAPGSASVPGHRAASRTPVPPPTSLAPAPVVASASGVTVPPVAPPAAHPEQHPLPVVTVPRHERGHETD